VRSFQPGPTDHEAAARLTRELGIHPVTAQVLARRGVLEVDDANRFLRPTADLMHDPGLFRDMERALDLLQEAVRGGKTIAVYGDYDVDGVSATTVLVRTLGLLGADTRSFIPDRLSEGYGLSGKALVRLREEGCDLVVTVDNGTSRIDEIAAARKSGLEMIVTDHHEPGPGLPDCPVINPKRRDSTYPFQGLAGCGVSFKLAMALAERFGLLHSDAFKKLVPDLLAVTAVGTVADVVPLRDENRSLVAMGLKALTATRHPGLRALLEVSRCTTRPVSPTDIAFKLGPRINAAGRLHSAQRALDLFLCEDPAEAATLAAKLDAGNRERQQIEREQAEEAYSRAEAIMKAGDEISALVLDDPSWHPGVIGIVAARVSEQYRKPAALIAAEGGDARGSARSFGHVRLHEALDACSHLLRTHGGHASAAGFTLPTERIPAFREAFMAAVAEQGEEEPAPREVDAELPLDAVSAPLASEIQMLQPFGTGNEEPVFCAFGVSAAGRPRRLGAEDRHLSFYAATDRTSVRAIAFNQGHKEHLVNGRFDISFLLRRREGPEEVELVVREICSAARDSTEP
jgi:single-stranded-DNA-specific exonuclease